MSFMLITVLTGNAVADHYLPSIELHLGNISNDTVMDGSGEIALGLTVIFEPERFRENIGAYFDLWGWGTDLPNTEFSTCIFCSIDDNIDVDVLTIGGGLLATYPSGNFQYYAQAGLSLVFVDYNLGGSIFGFQATAEEDSDTDVAIQYGFGLLYLTDYHSIGIHFRHFDIESSSDTFAIEDVDVGGDYAGLSFGWFF